MKELKSIILLVMTVLLLTGCEAMQVNDRMFVQMMGISEDNGIYELSVQVYSTSGSSGSSAAEYELYKGSGRSFYEARDMINRSAGRELYFGHCMTVVADENVLRDPEKLRVLAGSRVSIGSRVFCSEKPVEYVGMTDENGRLVGADRLSSSAEQYEKDGLCTVVCLKDVISAAQSGGFAVVPVVEDQPVGTAVIDMSGDTSLLSLNESAALRLIMGDSGMRLSVLGADLVITDTHISFYHQIDKGYEITLNVKCTMDERGAAEDLSLYEAEAEKMISNSAKHIFRRGVMECFSEIFSCDGAENCEAEIIANVTVTT